MRHREDEHMNPQELKKLLNDVLDERDRIDQHRHKADHEFITELRERYAARKELIDKVKKSIVGMIVVAIVSQIFHALYLVGHFILDNWSHIGSHKP